MPGRLGIDRGRAHLDVHHCAVPQANSIRTLWKAIRTLLKLIRMLLKPIRTLLIPIETYQNPTETYKTLQKPIRTLQKLIKTYRGGPEIVRFWAASWPNPAPGGPGKAPAEAPPDLQPFSAR